MLLLMRLSVAVCFPAIIYRLMVINQQLVFIGSARIFELIVLLLLRYRSIALFPNKKQRII